MDPYLERHWSDVHLTLVAESRRDLNRVLPDDLVARIDVRTLEPGPTNTQPPPFRYIRIAHRADKLVTVVGFLSPIDKGEGLEGYLEWRSALLAAGTSVVEIDLLRDRNSPVSEY